MKVGVPRIEFLGASIGEGKIQLQPHIIQKITDFPDDKLKTKSGMRSWLGILNYSRAYIPNLGTLLGPLYSKTSIHGDQRIKNSDWKIIGQIKNAVQRLPPLSIPPEKCYIILETDGCMEGWGGVCKWKQSKSDPRNKEEVCAYASGKFDIIKSTIDAEIYACIETMKALKIYYLDKEEITLRTDCQAIVSFFNKTANNKPSRIRWLMFVDFVTGTGVQVHFEHTEGKFNIFADQLSRLVAALIIGPTEQAQTQPQIQMLEEALTEVQGKTHQDKNVSTYVKKGFEMTIAALTGHYKDEVTYELNLQDRKWKKIDSSSESIKKQSRKRQNHKRITPSIGGESKLNWWKMKPPDE